MSSLRVGLRLGAAVAAVCVVGALAFASPAPVEGATFTVNTTSDATDGTCNATHCSLREAITVANATGGPDTIAFNIGGGGAQTITISTTQLPDITGPLTIDGTTQPGYTGSPLIRLDGVSGFIGLSIKAPASVVGLSITRFTNGVTVYPGGPGSVIRGSWIGLTPSGTGSGNWSVGVVISADDVVVGGTAASDRNVISNNDIQIHAGGDNTQILGNYIGTNPAGSAGFSFQEIGIELTFGSGVVGGSTASARNVIAGHNAAAPQGRGILVTGGTWSIAGNYIGVNASGTGVIPNRLGIQTIANTGSVTIGGASSAFRNLISGNADAGVVVDPTADAADPDVDIFHNYIGVGPDGLVPMGNGNGTSGDAGIAVLDGSATTQHNTIAFSAGDGILVTGSDTSAGISSNYIFLNDGLGIDLGNNGVTPNDSGDIDTGPNTLQNFPVITAATTTSSGTNVTVTAPIGGTGGLAVLNVYRSDACDPSGHGEGQLPVGITVGSVTPPTLNANINLGTAVTPGSFLTAQLSYEGSSEFGPCFTVPPCAAPSTDCDGFNDTAATQHAGPSNASATVDNCSALWNQNQLNTDGNFGDQTPPHAIDDKTWPMSDALGDACDNDRDNDGLLDGVEQGLPYAPCPTASAPTNPLLFDTDGDRFHDGAECSLGTDPASAASKPGSTPAGAAACGATGDSDGDKLLTRIEVCSYNTNPSVMDSDGDAGLDGARDGCEAASLNADRTVNSTDQLLLAQELLRVLAGGTPLASMDINKDGNINSADQLTMSFLIIPGGQCP